MKQVQMVVSIKQTTEEGLLKGIPIGVHKISFPISRLAFVDTTGGVNTLGGSFTSSTVEQVISDGATVDGVSYYDISFLPYD